MFDVETAKSLPISFFQIRDTDELEDAGKIIINRLCDEPNIFQEETAPMFQNPTLEPLEKCSEPMEIQDTVAMLTGISQECVEKVKTLLIKIERN